MSINDERNYTGRALKSVLEERANQDIEWGGSEHDDTHSPDQWVTYIVKHLGQAVLYDFNPTVFRMQMVRVAALAVAAVECVDRAVDQLEDADEH